MRSKNTLAAKITVDHPMEICRNLQFQGQTLLYPTGTCIPLFRWKQTMSPAHSLSLSQSPAQCSSGSGSGSQPRNSSLIFAVGADEGKAG